MLKSKKQLESSSSGYSSDESDTPSLKVLRGHALQSKVDRRVGDLDNTVSQEGKDRLKYKSGVGGGGGVEVSVKKWVPWPLMRRFWVE